MKRIAVLVTSIVVVAVVPAMAAKPPHPTQPTRHTHPAAPKTGTAPSGKRCTALNKGFYATGTLSSSATLTPGSSSGHFDGTLAVNVTRANHDAATGSQTFTLTNARVHFGKGVTSTTTAATDRVILHGKITELPHGCSTTGFTSVTTVRNVTIKAPKS